MAENTPAFNPAATQPALYYPYIHIDDENWLKGAILGFQQVRRMVPMRFTLKDGAITRRYSELSGPAGPLVEELYIDSSEIRETQRWLRLKIVDNLPQIESKYKKGVTPASEQSGPGAFQMHVRKFVDPELLALLEEHQLAWHSREKTEADPLDWITMHPTLGAAVMSTLAIAVARIHGLSVLTPSGRAHHELLANREEDVFEKLLDVPRPPAATSNDVTVEELSQVIITTGFDLTRLTADDILELLKQGKDLRAFRAAVAESASRIPPGVQGDERVKRLKTEAQAVLDEWNKYTNGLPNFAKSALIDAALDKAPEKLVEAGLAGAAAGGVSAAILGALPGLLVTVAVATGVKMFRRPNTPLRFLSRVDDLAGKRIGSIYVPQWGALAAQSALN
jgi:hypothetical protein